MQSPSALNTTVLLSIFNAISEKCLLLRPNPPTFTIVAGNQAFADICQMGTDELAGRSLQEAFSSNSDEPEPNGLKILSDSLRTVIQTKAIDTMATHRYDIRTPPKGYFEKRYWDSINTPILNADGDLVYILHTTKDVTEQVEARRQINDSEARLSEAIELAELGSWRYDLQTGKAFYSDRLKEWFGFDTNEMEPRNAAGAIAPADLGRVSAALQQAMDPRIGRFHLEHGTISLQTGQQRTVRVWGQTYFNDQQKPYLLIGTAQDVTAERQQQQQLEHQIKQRTSDLQTALTELQRSNETIQQMLDGSMAAIVLLDAVREASSGPSGPIIDFAWRGTNRAAEKIMSRNRPDFIRQQFLTSFPKDGQVFFEGFVDVVETGRPLRREYSYWNGHSTMWLDLSIVKDGDGIIATGLNITERKAVEQKARENTTHLQAVLNSSPAAIAFLKAVRDEHQAINDFVLVVYNQKFGQFVDQPIQQLKGQLASELAPRLWQQDTLLLLKQVLTTGQPIYREQSDSSDQETKWLGVSITREDDGLVITGLDITALKQAEQQQQQWLDELADSNQTLQGLEKVQHQLQQRSELLRSASHDLRSSFGLIQGAAWMLKMINTDEERTQVLGILQRNIGQMTAMLTQLLDYSRLEAGQEQVEMDCFNVAQLLRELGESAQPLADERGLWINTSGPAELFVDGDRVKVQRIVQNLLFNALKYTRTGGTTLYWSRTEELGHWQITVEDTGPGLPANLLNWLNGRLPGVSPEVELGLSHSSGFSSSGEGIGLTIVKRLCALISAVLSVESRADLGTRFTIYLPGANHP